MHFTLISVIIIALMALNIYSSVRKSYRKGLTKTLIRLGLLVFAATVGAAVSIGVAASLEELLAPVIRETSVYRDIYDNVGSAVDVAFVVFKMLASMLLYLPIFGLLRLFGAIIASIFTRIFVGKKKASTEFLKEGEELYVKRHRAISAGLGVLCGFILTVVLFTPVCGILKCSDSMIDLTKKFAGEDILEDTTIVKELQFYADDAGITVLHTAGGKMMFDLTTTTFEDGGVTNLNRELRVLKDIDIEEVKDTLFAMDSLDSTGVSRIKSVVDTANRSVLLKGILLGFIKDATGAWLNGESYMGVPRPSFGHPSIDVFMNEIFYVFTTSTLDTIEGDLDTLANLCGLFFEAEEIFSSGDYETMIIELNEKGMLNKVRAELSANYHMRTILYAADDLVMSVITDEIKNKMDYSDEACEVLFMEFAEILTDTMRLEGSARTTAVTQSVKESLSNYGVEVPDELTANIAEVLINAIGSGDSNVQLGNVQQFFDEYMNKMNEYTEVLPE